MKNDNTKEIISTKTMQRRGMWQDDTKRMRSKGIKVKKA